MNETSLTDEAKKFTDAALRYCDWVEGDTHTVFAARQLLLEIMLYAPCLEQYQLESETDEEFPGLDDDSGNIDEWKKIYKKLSDIEIGHYREFYDPFNFSAEEMTGNVVDDLADIYSDLYEGVQAYKAGFRKHPLYLWQMMFDTHWGEHAASAIRALDVHYRLKG